MAEDFMALYKQALAGLKTGGMTLQASLAEIEEGKKQAIAGGQQSLVSSGLSGTTMAAGVPIQAEKIAGRQRLGARGQAERTYLTTLASFAAFSQRGIEAQKQRDFEASQLKSQQQADWQAQFGVGAGGGEKFTSSLGGGFGGEPFQVGSSFAQDGGGTTQAQQFPSLYDQGGGTAPNLMGGGAVAGGGYTPQAGDYSSVASGPGGGLVPVRHVLTGEEKMGTVGGAWQLNLAAARKQQATPVPSTSAGFGTTPTYTGSFYA